MTYDEIPYNHNAMVASLCKPGDEILKSLTPEKCDLWHVASCVPAEGGELFDAVKKYVIYGHEIDRENIIEELGDLEFFMARVRQILIINREMTLVANIEKLKERYPSGYSDTAAMERADK